jgi:hypothetical protein
MPSLGRTRTSKYCVSMTAPRTSASEDEGSANRESFGQDFVRRLRTLERERREGGNGTEREVKAYANFVTIFYSFYWLKGWHHK